ncbi:MAG: PglD-related sugar-binding protein [Gammaproteobacteria bacterium]
MRDVYVYGAGGHGKVVADLLLAAGFNRAAPPTIRAFKLRRPPRSCALPGPRHA